MTTTTPHQDEVQRHVDAPTAAVPPTLDRPTPPANGDDHGRRPSLAWLLTLVAAVAALVSATVTFGAARLLDDPTPATTDAAAPAEPVADTGADAPAVPAPAPEGGLTVSQVAEAVAPSVAGVEVGRGGQGGEGSAVIFDADGYLLTNNHVVQGATSIQVILPDGGRYDAEVVGTDPRSDLAVLRVDATGLPAASFATTAPKVGEPVVAIGSPFGLDGSVTSGIVSALDRDLDGGNATLVGMIQTDAAINPGNSGGALVNDRGQVVGINTAIVSGSGASAGVGFAIPSTTAMDVAEEIRETGQVRWAYLGIRGLNVDPQVARAYGLDAESGAVIDSVEPGSAADDAGLQPGDLVVGMGGEEIASMADLAGAIRAQDPGDRVTLEIIRDGETLTLEATLGEATN